MAAEVPNDVVELILLGLDVKDILRCKCVCKSWHSFISSPAFVKAHLKHQNYIINIIGGRHRKTIISRLAEKKESDLLYPVVCKYVVGSCNGLVFIYSKSAEFEVANPCTREIKKLQTPLFLPDERKGIIFGFGYDASTDDYKVVVGIRMKSVFDERTYIYVLALKSIWKFIGEVNYTTFRSYAAIFCDGALHWFMRAANKYVIMSLDLSTEQFQEVPQPAEADYRRQNLYHHVLGVIEECLCIYSLESRKIWVMKNNKWELYNHNNECKYDMRHYLICLPVVHSQNKSTDRHVYTIDDGRLVPSTAWYRINDSMFVKSLVSPYPPRFDLN